jgi:hypothetical protein
LIFLDLRRDRYFRLPRPLEESFLAYINGDGCLPPDIDRLVNSEILTDAPRALDVEKIQSIEDASSSAIEQAPAARAPTLSEVLETTTITLSTKWRLKTITLKNVLDSIHDYRNQRSAPITAGFDPSIRQHLIEASAAFRRARLYVPINTSCLLDSLAIIKFLARKGLSARLVFGVACDPFSAHCWAQVGNLVLNDTVGNTQLHTPIRVI